MTAHTEGLQGLTATPVRTRREHAVGALRWQVEVLGEGPTLLLLHGTGASAHSWRDIAPVLARSHRVVVPDLPGHRRSAPLPARQRSLAGLAEALAGLLQSLNRLDAPDTLSTPTAHAPPRVAAVIGHSAGAALMVRMALDGALPGSQLIGLNAALLPFDGLARLVCAPLARLIADTPLLLPLVARLAATQAHKPAALRRLIASTGSTLDDTGIALYGRLMREPAHIAGVLSMMADWDLDQLQDDLPRLQQPLHLLVGADDLTVPPQQADRVARLAPRVQVQRLAGLGHLAHEEAPQRLVATLLGLLGRPGPG